MSQITVWKCDDTGQLFEDQIIYRKHLRALASKRIADKKFAVLESLRFEVFTEMRNSCRNTSQIVDFVKGHWWAFHENAIANSSSSNRMTPEDKDASLTGMFLTLNTYSLNISNTHSAPLSKPTNFTRKADLPTSYPGWNGNIEYDTSVQRKRNYLHGSEMWKNTGINTESGGYAAQYYYGVKLFAEDWPAMAESYEAASQFKQLTDSELEVTSIAHRQFDTAEKVKEFEKQLPEYQFQFEKASVWKALNSDRRPIRTILKDIEE